MVKDRLEEFRKKAKLPNGEQNGEDVPDRRLMRNQSFPTESTEFLNDEHWDDVEMFLEHIKNLHKKMKEMEAILKGMHDIHDEILKSPFADPNLSKNLNDKVEVFKSLSHTVNNVLKSMNKDMNRIGESNEANFRIKKNQMMTTNRKFHNLMVEFSNEQVRYREKSQQRIRSYLSISGVEMDDNAIEEAIENGRIFDTVSILMAERDKKAIFEDVKSRHDDIIKLEASIRELHEIFQDMSMLVESQGEILNNIEANINSATDYANKAFHNVRYAKEARNRNIKLKIFAVICVIILVIVLFFVGTAVFCFYMPFVCR